MADTPQKPTIRKWTKSEEAELLAKGSVTGRSEGAQSIRRKAIAARKVSGGEDPEEVAKTCGVTVAEITEQIKIETAKKRKAANVVEGAVKTVNSSAAKDIDGIIASLRELKKRIA